MRARRLGCLLLLGALCAGPVLAVADAVDERPQRRERREQFRQRWHDAGPEERRALERGVRERLGRASPGERRGMREQLRRARRKAAHGRARHMGRSDKTIVINNMLP